MRDDAQLDSGFGVRLTLVVSRPMSPFGRLKSRVTSAFQSFLGWLVPILKKVWRELDEYTTDVAENRDVIDWKTTRAWWHQRLGRPELAVGILIAFVAGNYLYQVLPQTWKNYVPEPSLFTLGPIQTGPLLSLTNYAGLAALYCAACVWLLPRFDVAIGDHPHRKGLAILSNALYVIAGIMAYELVFDPALPITLPLPVRIGAAAGFFFNSLVVNYGLSWWDDKKQIRRDIAKVTFRIPALTFVGTLSVFLDTSITQSVLLTTTFLGLPLALELIMLVRKTPSES